mmetsp:Transcript_10205/g.27228  ORF Transcript_10205/g.27228 Transcript_10205/m.27228 type:complete len:83 (+) Transcript_10205:177-425(+)
MSQSRRCSSVDGVWLALAAMRFAANARLLRLAAAVHTARVDLVQHGTFLVRAAEDVFSVRRFVLNSWRRAGLTSQAACLWSA